MALHKTNGKTHWDSASYDSQANFRPSPKKKPSAFWPERGFEVRATDTATVGDFCQRTLTRVELGIVFELQFSVEPT